MTKQNSDLNSKISGKFEAGVSGNPKGRPRGIADKRTEIRNLLYPHAEALVQKTIELALAGDSTALRICLERLIARAKSNTAAVPIDNFDLTKAENLPLAGSNILQAVSREELTLEEAKIACDLIETQRKLIETANLEARVNSIEHILNHRGVKNHATSKR